MIDSFTVQFVLITVDVDCCDCCCYRLFPDYLVVVLVTLLFVGTLAVLYCTRIYPLLLPNTLLLPRYDGDLALLLFDCYRHSLVVVDGITYTPYFDSHDYVYTFNVLRCFNSLL